VAAIALGRRLLVAVALVQIARRRLYVVVLGVLVDALLGRVAAAALSFTICCKENTIGKDI
jgi:hypothetical protein